MTIDTITLERIPLPRLSLDATDQERQVWWQSVVEQIEDIVTPVNEAIDAINAVLETAFLTLGTTDALDAERLFTPASGQLSATDGGANGTYTLGLADTAVTPNTYGSATETVSFTVDQKGRLTAAQEYTLNTDNVTEGVTNLYFTNARARSAISAGTGLSYDSSTGVMSLPATGVTAGTYASPTSITVDAQGRITAIS